MEFSIKNSTQYLVLAGSYAYGTNTVTSDYDLRGWAIPPTNYFFSFDKKFEQNDQAYKFSEYPFAELLQQYVLKNSYRMPEANEEIDQCVYDVRKFFFLCANCNPNVLEHLFVEDKDILLCTKLGEEVRKNRNLFLSARAKHAFTGYAVAQLKRITTHRRWLLNPRNVKPIRAEYGLPETAIIPPDQRDAAEKLINDQVRDWLFQDIDEKSIGKTVLAEMHNTFGQFIAQILNSKDFVVNYLDEKELFNVARLTAAKKIGMSDNYIAVIQAERAYRNALTEYSQYHHWVATRNPARAELEKKFGYDCKHAMALVRLLRTGKSLLLTGHYDVRRDDAAELLAIRNGAWSYEQLIAYLALFEKEMTEVYDNKKYVVPHKPDMNALSELCGRVVKMAIG